MAFKIYTKTGDKGKTGLFGGARLPKHHVRIGAYGTVDELNAYVGQLFEVVTEKNVKEVLLSVQNHLFTIGAMLAKDPAKDVKVPLITESDITMLEASIDEMEGDLEPLKQFILPSGHPVTSMAHIARTVCRRAERDVVALDAEESVDPLILMYLNRLADWLFVASRFINKHHGGAERPWVQPE
jgi:cob(I)alamin adenosyltransferase